MKLTTELLASAKTKSAAYPSKTTINLAMREKKTTQLSTLIIGGIAIVVLAVLVAKFAVIDQYSRLSKAEAAYNVVHQQYVDDTDRLKNFEQVNAEYKRYCLNVEQNSDDGTAIIVADRLDVLNMIETYLMSAGSVNSVDISANTINVTMSGMNLQQISSMIVNLKTDPLVQNVSLTLAETIAKTATDSLDFNLVITVNPTSDSTLVAPSDQTAAKKEGAQ